jgi:hypothetical protein
MITACSLALAGCGMHKPDAGQPAKAPAASSGSAAASVGDKATPPTKTIAEFDDIPVPSELTREDDLSFVYEAPGVTLGVITYSGYYKGASIAKFFRSEMPKYDWQFLNAFSEGNKFMVAFLKSNRSCVISIEEGSLDTRVTIKVGPTSAG